MIKPEYSNIVVKKLDPWNYFPNFSSTVDKYVKLALGIIHDKLLSTNRPHLITKEIIKVVIRLYDTRPVPILKYVKNEVVMELTGATYDKRNLATKPITNHAMKHAEIMMGHKIYFTNRENSIYATSICTNYVMAANGVDYDLCELPQ